MMFFALFSCYISSIFLFHHVSGRGSRILNGIEVKPEDNKHTVAITHDGEFICGGSIIDARLILTAAHCLIDETDRFRKGHFEVIAGSTNLSMNQTFRTTIDVQAIYAPTIYNGTLWQTSFPEGDIAVLKLRKPLSLSVKSTLEKLKLPQGDEPYINQVAVVTGYGLDKVETDVMKDGQVTVMNASTSLKLYKAYSIVFDHIECSNHYEIMYDSNLCGKVINYEDDTPQGVCEGDSGGPVVYNNDVVIGVVTGSAPACNENEYPSVFTNVASFLSFIQDVERDNQVHMRVKLGVRGQFF